MSTKAFAPPEDWRDSNTGAGGTPPDKAGNNEDKGIAAEGNRVREMMEEEEDLSGGGGSGSGFFPEI